MRSCCFTCLARGTTIGPRELREPRGLSRWFYARPRRSRGRGAVPVTAALSNEIKREGALNDETSDRSEASVSSHFL